MIRKRYPLRAVTTLAVIISITPAASKSAWAESQPEPPSQSWYDAFDVHSGAWSGALGLSYMNGTQSMNSATEAGSKSSNSHMGETLKISNSDFYILSPRLCQGSMTLDLDFNQDKNVDSGSSTVMLGNAIGYSIEAAFLQEMPYSASIAASLAQVQELQPFGGRVVGTTQSAGARFLLRQDSIFNDWGYHWVEANLDINENHNSTVTTSFGHSQSSDETILSLGFNAHKGFETADLGVKYQFSDNLNAAFGAGNGFQSNSVGLQYSFDFGPTLNRRLDSKLDFMTHNGYSPSTTISNGEHLHIDHYQNLSTDYQYGLDYQTSGGSSSIGQNGGFSVSHKLYENLSSSAGVTGSQTTLGNGSTITYGGQLGQGYHHSLPWNGSFSANWSGGYQLSSNALSSSRISVLDEAHNAPTPFGAGVGFPLSHSFAVAASVVVINVRDGGRIPLVAGFDYTVVNENNQITIVPSVGSLLIRPGDPLVVSYVYQVDANLKFATETSGYGMGVNYHWIAVAYSHKLSTQKPLSATSSLFLQSTQQDGVQLSLQGTFLEGTRLEIAANANMNFDNVKSTASDYEAGKLTSSLSGEILPNMRLVLSMNASETKFIVPDQHKNTALSARGSLNLPSYHGWYSTASIDWSTHKDSGTPAETLVQAIAQSGVTLGKLSLSASVALGEWQRLSSRSSNRSFNINATRQFR